MPREITKIGLAVIDGSRLLLVRKKDTELFILPGGKPEGNESDERTLVREIDEELGCALDDEQLTFLGAFSDKAAELEGTTVVVRLYLGRLKGRPRPRAEIAELQWYDLVADSTAHLAPSLRNSIVPFLSERTDPLRASRRKPTSTRG